MTFSKFRVTVGVTVRVTVRDGAMGTGRSGLDGERNCRCRTPKAIVKPARKRRGMWRKASQGAIVARWTRAGCRAFFEDESGRKGLETTNPSTNPE